MKAIKQIIMVLVSIILFTGCSLNAGLSAGTEAASSPAEKASSFSEEDFKTGQEIEKKLNAAVPAEIKDYISTVDIKGISAAYQDGKLHITTRVTVLPDAIPMVADAVCSSIKETIPEYGIDSYTAVFMYYTEGNDGKVSNQVLWKTEDGVNGVFMEKDAVNMTLDELYEHYNNFGKSGAASGLRELTDDVPEEVQRIYYGFRDKGAEEGLDVDVKMKDIIPIGDEIVTYYFYINGNAIANISYYKNGMDSYDIAFYDRGSEDERNKLIALAVAAGEDIEYNQAEIAVKPIINTYDGKGESKQVKMDRYEYQLVRESDPDGWDSLKITRVKMF